MGRRIFSNFRRNFNIHYIMKAQLEKEDFLEVELAEREYSTDEKQAVKDIQAILELSGIDKYFKIVLPKPRT